MVQAIALIFNIRSISPAAYVAAFSCTKCHCQKLIFRGALKQVSLKYLILLPIKYNQTTESVRQHGQDEGNELSNISQAKYLLAAHLKQFYKNRSARY